MKSVILSLVILAAISLPVSGQSTEFTYQGSLSSSGAPANGTYDLEFALYDAVSGGTQVGPTVSRDGVAVADGVFAVLLDFGNQFPGTDRYLEIRVRQAGGGPFTILSPRQKLSSTPYAIRSLNSLNASQLGGVPAIEYLTATSAASSFIQNTTTQQPSSNFNISGTGTAGILSAITQFNAGVSRIIGFTGGLHVGFNTGSSSTGSSNAFFGNSAGRDTTSGNSNSFFGTISGLSNLTGDQNSFFGSASGNQNTIGSNNSFFGYATGTTLINGSNNTLLGASANVGSSALSFGTAVGAGAVVSNDNSVVLGRSLDTVRIPGSLNISGTVNGNGSGLTNLNAVNISTGTIDPARLGAAAILNQTTQQAASNFNISGTGAANILNAGTQFNLGGSRILASPGTNNLAVGLAAGTAVSTGTENTFIGGSAGAANSQGARNTFVGFSAGASNSVGTDNAFFGRRAGFSNSGGASNSFFGQSAGENNVNGNLNSFFGYNAGFANTSGSGNSFFGFDAGDSNTTGTSNSFFGSSAGGSTTAGVWNSFFGRFSGLSNVAGSENAFYGYASGEMNTVSFNSFFGSLAGRNTSSGLQNAFFGHSSGLENTQGGQNAFFGANAGDSNISGLRNTLIGAFADVGGPGLTNASAVGAQALVNQSNSLVLGSISGVNGSSVNTNVGIGTTTPAHRLTIGAGTNLNVSTADVAVFGTNGAYATVQDNTASVQSIVGADASPIGGAPGAAIYGSVTPHGISFRTNNGTRMVIDHATQNVGIGTTTPQDRLDVNGIVRVATLGTTGGSAICRNGSNQLAACSSSLRYKTNITGFGLGLDLIERLRPIAFDWRDGQPRDLGLAAEDVAAIEPLLVTLNTKGEVEGVKYDRISVVLVNALKEQQKQIEELRAELALLREMACSNDPTAKICRK